MLKYVAAEYDRQEGEKKVVCPGEESCDLFESAAGATRKEKERNACIDGKCPLFPTKNNTQIALETLQRMDLILYRAIELRKQRQSGCILDKFSIPSKVFNCLKLLDDFYDAFERDLKIENKKLIEILIKKPSL